MTKSYGNDYEFDLESGSFIFYGYDPASEEEDETTFTTENGCEYSIFEDDEMQDGLHIEIDPNFVWSKDDVWELVDQLLYKVGEIDEDGNLIGEHAEKPLFIVKTREPLSREQLEMLSIQAEQALDKANIDAIPLVLDGGLDAYFERPRR